MPRFVPPGGARRTVFERAEGRCEGARFVAWGVALLRRPESFGAATVLGVSLGDRGCFGAGAAHLAVVVGMAAIAAMLAYVRQRYLVATNVVTDGMPEAMVRAQQLMPALWALGLIVAGGVVPVALVAYWVGTSVWTWGSQPSSGSRFPRLARERPHALVD